MKKTRRGMFAIGAVAALCVSALPSAADSVDQHSVNVKLILRPRVTANLNDPTMRWDRQKLSDMANAPTSDDVAESISEDRAEITVHSNADYVLAVTVPETCDPDIDVNGNSYRHARLSDGSSGKHIGGTFFLDREIDKPQDGDKDITHWNGNVAQVVTEEHGGWKRKWGLGLLLHPGGNGQSLNPTCADASRADSGGIYSTTADLTVSVPP